MSWQSYLAVALGGALGSVLRFAVALYFKERGWSATFPWSTFVINVTGSFLLGVLVVWLAERTPWLLLLGVGFCGGYTTFSTFSVETERLFAAGRLLAAFGYSVGSVVAGLLAAWLGVLLARAVFGRP